MDFRVCGDVLESKLKDLAKRQGVTVSHVITDALNHYVYLAEISSKNPQARLLLIESEHYDDLDAGVVHLELPRHGPRLPHLRLVDDGQQRTRERKEKAY